VQSPTGAHAAHTPHLQHWVSSNPRSSFVATSLDPRLKWEGKYLYKIRPPVQTGIDLNATLGRNYPPAHRFEQEVTFPGGIEARYIEGAYQLWPSGPMGKWIPPIRGKFIPNPKFNP
jgi:hypothetical protein